MSQSRHDEFLAEYGEAVQDSPSQALEVVKGQIRWLEYVPESEFTTGERERILSACVRFYQSIRPLTAKYID